MFLNYYIHLHILSTHLSLLSLTLSPPLPTYTAPHTPLDTLISPNLLPHPNLVAPIPPIPHSPLLRIPQAHPRYTICNFFIHVRQVRFAIPVSQLIIPKLLTHV